jgi:hypothetical protein
MDRIQPSREITPAGFGQPGPALRAALLAAAAALGTVAGQGARACGAGLAPGVSWWFADNGLMHSAYGPPAEPWRNPGVDASSTTGWRALRRSLRS